MPRHLRLGPLAGLGLSLLLAGAPAHAKLFFVGSGADRPDASPGDGRCADARHVCTLRAAVMEANRNSGEDLIFLLADVQLSIPTATADEDGQEVDAAAGDLDVTDDLEVLGLWYRNAISGPGDEGPDAFRLFQLEENVRLGLHHLTLRDGRTSTRLDGLGGGVLNMDGELELSTVTLTGNEAYFGGAIFSRGELQIRDSRIVGNSSTAENGGAVYNVGLMEIRRTSIVDNSAEDGTVSSFNNVGEVLIVDSTIRQNGGFYPGGLENGGQMTVVRSTISHNVGSVGGILNDGMLTLVSSTVSHNRAVRDFLGPVRGGREHRRRRALYLLFDHRRERN